MSKSRQDFLSSPILNLINGEWRCPQSGIYLDSWEPATGRIWAKIPDSNSADVEEAVAAAVRAFPEWSKTSASYRSHLLHQLADLVDEHAEELIEFESRDQGKPCCLARQMDVPRVSHNLRSFGQSILHEGNHCRTHNELSAISFTRREPVGVAALIAPWNLPLYLLTFKMAPCLAYGNTCIAKPSEFTSMSAAYFGQLVIKAGFPPGVINIVFGTGSNVGEPLVLHPQVPLISFTGSTMIGQRIQALAAPFTKKTSLELGGKNSAIIFDDADINKSVVTCIRSSFTNQGEICLCTSRIFIQRSIYDEFKEKFVMEAKNFHVGEPTGEYSKLGALISSTHLAKVKNYVDEALSQGAISLCGRGSDNQDDWKKHLNENFHQGYYMAATVLEGALPNWPCMQEEIFGPVTCLIPFDSEKEVIEWSNNVRYGLCSSVFTRDLDRAHRMSASLQVGTVWINCWLIRDLNLPFGGCKDSGIGREGTKDSHDFYTEAKTVCMQLN